MANNGFGHGGRHNNQKPKNFKITFKKFMKELREVRLQIILTILFTTVGVICTIIIPKILGNAFTEIGKPLLGLSINMKVVLQLLITITSLYFISFLFNTASQVLMGRASQKICYNLRNKLKEKLTRVPLNYYDTHQAGDVLSSFTNDVDNIGTSLQQSLNQIIQAVIMVVGVLVMMITINLWLTLIVVVMLPVSMLLSGFVMKRSQKHFIKQAANLGSVNAHIEEVYTNQKTVKAFTNEKVAISEFETRNQALYESSQKSNFYSGLLMPLVMFANNLNYVILSIVSCIFITNGISNPNFSPVTFTLEFGFLASFLQYSQMFTQPLSQLAQLVNTFQTTLAALERIYNILEEKEEEPELVKQALGDINGKVEFQNLTFGYSPDKILLKNVNVQIEPGQMVAIVGPTGAGKTTIVNLIMRFYELNDGKILIDNKNIHQVSKSELRNKIGMVLQDTWLFNGTVKENISYGKPDARMDEIVDACKKASVDHFIKTLPQGYDTVISESAGNISQGQKQLLTIARAILTNPQIMILDEATSNIDTRTEVAIQKAMAECMKGRTSFVIAHRLSTIVNADKILVVNNGDIIEQGTHEELLKNKGFYYNLYNSQFA